MEYCKLYMPLTSEVHKDLRTVADSNSISHYALFGTTVVYNLTKSDLLVVKIAYPSIEILDKGRFYNIAKVVYAVLAEDA